MIAIALIAIAAGGTSALMFASVISGAPISLVLFFLAPLPLMVAALGWGSLSAIIGGLVATTALFAIFGLPYCIAFVIMVAVPAWWLGHLVMLGRPIAGENSSGNGASPVAPDLEWYPVGRLVLWIVAFAAVTTMTSLLTLGTDAATITGALRQGWLVILGPLDPATAGEIEQLLDALVALAPVAGTLVAVPILTLNLWLAATVTAKSGRLRRPWPDLRGTVLPPMTLAALSVAIAFCFIGGLLAILAQVAATALMMAYALIGFAVLHTVTLALKSRPLWLGCIYVIVTMLVWPVLAAAALGLADAIFGIRQRFLRARPPPLPSA